jgi:hypothetical protein
LLFGNDKGAVKSNQTFAYRVHDTPTRIHRDERGRV